MRLGHVFGTSLACVNYMSRDAKEWAYKEVGGDLEVYLIACTGKGIARL